MYKLLINSIMVVVITPLILLASYTFAYELLIIKSEVETMESIEVNDLYPTELKACDYCGIRTQNISIESSQTFICNDCKLKEVNND